MFPEKIWMQEQEYRTMTPAVAKAYFAWFKENIANEMESLQAGMLIDPIAKKISLDYTPESLIPLYEWFLSVKKYKKLSEEQIREDYALAPDFILQEMLGKPYAPTIGSTDLAVKLGIYLGEVFVRNDSDLYWDYVKKPKNDVAYNRPVICGFRPPGMDKHPTYQDVLSGCMPTYSSSKHGEKDKNSFYERYQLWMDNKELFYSPVFSPELYKKIWHELMFGPNKAKDKSDFSPKAILQKMKDMP